MYLSPPRHVIDCKITRHRKNVALFLISAARRSRQNTKNKKERKRKETLKIEQILGNAQYIGWVTSSISTCCNSIMLIDFSHVDFLYNCSRHKRKNETNNITKNNQHYIHGAIESNSKCNRVLILNLAVEPFSRDSCNINKVACSEKNNSQLRWLFRRFINLRYYSRVLSDTSESKREHCWSHGKATL